MSPKSCVCPVLDRSWRWCEPSCPAS